MPKNKCARTNTICDDRCNVSNIYIILSLFILYGHILKQRKDPQVIFGPRSYIEFPENGEFFDIEQEDSNIYKGKIKDVPNSNSNLNTDFL